MCQYSLEGHKTRKAKEGETVYVVANSHGAFSSEAGMNTHTIDDAVCVLYGQKVTIEDLQFAPGVRLAPELDRLRGKRQVVTLRQIWPNGKYGDHFEFEDGVMMPTMVVSSRCPIYVGIKSDSKKGMDRIAEALTEVEKTTPSGDVMTAIKRVVTRKRKVTT